MIVTSMSCLQTKSCSPLYDLDKHQHYSAEEGKCSSRHLLTKELFAKYEQKMKKEAFPYYELPLV